MKLSFDIRGKNQPDPFVFEDDGRFYMYVTAYEGVEAYSAPDLFSEWKFEGTVLKIDGCKNYWAPCIIRLENIYYMTFLVAVRVFLSIFLWQARPARWAPLKIPSAFTTALQ